MSTDDQDGNLYPFTPPPPSPTQAPGGQTPDGQLPIGRPRQPRRLRITKTAAGLALILGAGAGAAAVASATTSGANTSPPGASATTTPRWSANSGSSAAPLPRPRRFPGPALPGGPLPFFGFGGLDGLGPDGTIHASYTLKGPKGNYETIDAQYGTAEAVSSGSITVKSADGFSQTYTVGSSTVVYADYNGILSVKVGDTISIQGLVSGSTVTAERVLDVTQVQANRKSWAPGPPDGPGGPVGPPSPGGTGGSAA
jgi:hypothetical protein